MDCAEVFCRVSGITSIDGRVVMESLGSIGNIDVDVQEVMERVFTEDLVLLKENNLFMLLNFLLGLLFLEDILHIQGLQLHSIKHHS